MSDAGPAITGPRKQPAGEKRTLPPPGLASNSILALSALRSVIGVASLLAPTLTCRVFFVDISGGGPGTMLTRLVGARELALGGLLLYSLRSGSVGLRHTMIANLVTDSLDIVSCLLAEATGAIGWETTSIFCGSAVGFVGLGFVGLRGL